MSNVTPSRPEPIWFSVLTRTVDVDYFWVPGECRDATESLVREWYNLFLSDNHLDKSQPNVPTILLADFGGSVTVVFGGLLASKGDGARPILNALAICLRPQDRAVAYQLASGLLEGGERADRISAELIKISEDRCRKPFPSVLDCLSGAPKLSQSGSDPSRGGRVEGVMFRVLDGEASQEASSQMIAVGSQLAGRQAAHEGTEEIGYLFVRAKIIDPNKKEEFSRSIHEKGILIRSGTILSIAKWPGPKGCLLKQKKKWGRFPSWLIGFWTKAGSWTRLALSILLLVTLLGVVWMAWMGKTKPEPPSKPPQKMPVDKDAEPSPALKPGVIGAKAAGLVGLGFSGNGFTVAVASGCLVTPSPRDTGK